MTSYIVKENDTLDSIARNFGVSTIDIINSNNLSSYYLIPGTTLIIPSPNDSVFIDYTVNKGDSLYSIANKYNTDPVILAEINGLKLYDYIYPNQIIIVPKKGINLYITKEGDNIGSLINNSQVTLNDLQRYNKNIYIMPGQLIITREY